MNIRITDFVSAHSCFDKTGRRLNMQSRNACGIILPKCGAVSFTQNGKTVIASPDCPVFVPEGAYYLNECLENADSLVINFHAETDISEITALTPVTRTAVQNHFDILCGISIKAVSGELDTAEKYRALSEIYMLLSMLFRRTENKSEPELLFDRAVDIIRSDYADPSLSCSSIAARLNLSQVYLRRIFNRFSKLPTGQYITRIRMEQARLLLSEKVPVKQAAAQVGYSDVYGFSRAYARYFGFSPAKTNT